jgi:hypothetical protein
MPDRSWLTGSLRTPLVFRYHLPLKDAVQTMGQRRMEVPCVNDDADKIRSANSEKVLKRRIFFLFGSRLFLRYEHSVRK